MAARYWIGGTGNWSDTAHWSETSGGIGGASVPTMNDDVYFDSNSGTGTITVNAIANMRDLTFAQTQLITLANAAYAFNIYGYWTLSDNAYLATSFTGTGYVYLKATTSVKITSNGCTRGWNRLYFDGVGGEWKLQDNLNIGNTSIYLTNGILDLNNYTLTQTSQFNTATGTKTLTLGSGKLITQAWQNTTATGFTFNQNTGTVEISTSAASTLTGANTFYNLMFTFGANVNSAISLASNITVSNTFTPVGNNASNYRGLIASNIIGTPITITCNGTITASNVDFRDIIGAGTANWDLSAIEGGSGDCGGNSGITFTPAQTQYFKHTLGAVNWSDATKWFSNYERTIQGRVPLPQDDAIFDENSFTGASTLNVNVPRIGGLNMEGVNQSIAFYLLNIIECHGSFILSNLLTTGMGQNVYFLGVGSNFFNTKNKTFIQFRFLRGTYINQSNLSGGRFFVLGSLPIVYIGDFDALLLSFYQTGGKFYLGNGTISIIQGQNSDGFYSLGLIFPENSTIKFIPTLGSANPQLGANNSFNRVWFSGSGDRFFIVVGNNTFNELIIDSGRKVRFTNGTTQTINKLTAIGTPTNQIKIDSTTASRFNLLKTGSEPNECNFIDISNSNASPSGSWSAGYNSNDMGNNAGWEFNADDFVPQIINL